MKKYIMVLFVMLIAGGCEFGASEPGECRQYGAIEASLEWIPFTDSVKQADLIAEVEILDSETVLEHMCKTKHGAKVVQTLVGEVEGEITFLQSGSDRVLLIKIRSSRQVTPIFSFYVRPRAKVWLIIGFTERN